MKHKIKDKYDYFYNIESKEGTWVEPDHFVHDSSQLTKEDVQVQYVFKTDIHLQFLVLNLGM